VVPALPAERLHELGGKRISHYQLGQVLARGQSGIVFRAYDDKHDRQAAFKVLWPHLAGNDEEVKRFVRTMRTILPLRHPHLVALYGAGRSRPYCWLALEYVEGAESAAEVVTRAAGGRLPDWQVALGVLRDVAGALAFAHGRNILHRNITPKSVLIGRGGAAKLGGLVLAKALEGSLADPLTQPGEVLGDVLYMSPERTTGGLQAADTRADLYGLGATAYALLTGRPPLQGATFVQTVLQIRQEQPLPPRSFQPAVPAPLEAAVLRLLAKRPEDRFQTAGELLTHLGPLIKSRKAR
jgi:serine/threonine protein kinase